MSKKAIFIGAGIKEFHRKTDGLQVLLSQAIFEGYSEVIEEALQVLNSFFTEFKRGRQDFAAEMKGIHLISNYKGVNLIRYTHCCTSTRK